MLIDHIRFGLTENNKDVSFSRWICKDLVLKSRRLQLYCKILRLPKTEKFHNESVSNQDLDKTNIAGQGQAKMALLKKKINPRQNSKSTLIRTDNDQHKHNANDGHEKPEDRACACVYCGLRMGRE